MLGYLQLGALVKRRFVHLTTGGVTERISKTTKLVNRKCKGLRIVSTRADHTCVETTKRYCTALHVQITECRVRAYTGWWGNHWGKRPRKYISLEQVGTIPFILRLENRNFRLLAPFCFFRVEQFSDSSGIIPELETRAMSIGVVPHGFKCLP